VRSESRGTPAGITVYRFFEVRLEPVQVAITGPLVKRLQAFFFPPAETFPRCEGSLPEEAPGVEPLSPARRRGSLKTEEKPLVDPNSPKARVGSLKASEDSLTESTEGQSGSPNRRGSLKADEGPLVSALPETTDDDALVAAVEERNRLISMFWYISVARMDVDVSWKVAEDGTKSWKDLQQVQVGLDSAAWRNQCWTWLDFTQRFKSHAIRQLLSKSGRILKQVVGGGIKQVEAASTGRDVEKRPVQGVQKDLLGRQRAAVDLLGRPVEREVDEVEDDDSDEDIVVDSDYFTLLGSMTPTSNMGNSAPNRTALRGEASFRSRAATDGHLVQLGQVADTPRETEQVRATPGSDSGTAMGSDLARSEGAVATEVEEAPHVDGPREQLQRVRVQIEKMQEQLFECIASQNQEDAAVVTISMSALQDEERRLEQLVQDL